MKNLDTISKRILVISVSIAIVALSISALLFSVGHAFASNESERINIDGIEQTTIDEAYKAVASSNGIATYSVSTGYIKDWIGTDANGKTYH